VLTGLVTATLAVALATAAPAQAGAERSRHYVLVHGAWHGAWAWYRVRALLEKRGHTVTVVDLPSHGIDRTPPATVTLNDYAASVLAVVDDAAEPVVLVGHSMAGIVISAVAEARPQKVAKLLSVAAYLLPSGTSLLDGAARDVDSLLLEHLVLEDGVVAFAPGGLAETFYAASPAADVSLARTLVVPNPALPLATPLTLTPGGFGRVRRFYVRTSHDRAVTPAIQDEMLAALPCERVFRMRSDHSPFFSRPRRLAAVLLKVGRL
jgi:pimeloyl-ACP methyl ester carboxylesterase